MSGHESQGEVIGQSGIDYRDVSVFRLNQAMTSGSLTAAELVRFYLTRIERHAGLGAVISVSEDAVEQAAAIDAARASGTALGPLAGIPVLIKDNISVAGYPATAGSPALAGAAANDAFLVGRLRQAGAVLLGKANLSEWANFRSRHSSSGWSTLGGQAVNPHGAGRNPSGSSSGSAVAIAAGLAPLAVGTETDGSIVSPSHACGIVGLKPTVGLVSRSGIVPISLDQDTAGPMTRCVADAAALVSVMAGVDDADEPTAGAAGHVCDYNEFLDPAAVEGARIGVWRDGAARAIPASRKVLDDAVDVLRARGAEIVDPVELQGADKINDNEFLALHHEFKSDLNTYLSAVGGEHPMSLRELIDFNNQNATRVLTHFGQDVFEQAEATGGRQAAEGQSARADAVKLARSGLDRALTDHRLDAIFTISGDPAWLTDYVLGDHHSAGTSSPAAVAGCPSITVPAGRASGLPVGVSFIGPAWSEPRLLALAYGFEQAMSAGR